MNTIASQITSLAIVYSTIYSGADQSKHQSSASLAFVRWIHRGPVNSPHKWPVTRKMFPFDDVIMFLASVQRWNKKLRPVIKRHLDSTAIMIFRGMVSHLTITPYSCLLGPLIPTKKYSYYILGQFETTCIVTNMTKQTSLSSDICFYNNLGYQQYEFGAWLRSNHS